MIFLALTIVSSHVTSYIRCNVANAFLCAFTNVVKMPCNTENRFIPKLKGEPNV